MSGILLEKNKFLSKISQLNWGLMFLLTCVALVGATCLYSAGGGDINKWALPHMFRFGFAFCVMLVIALIDVRFWFKISWLAYFGTFVLLVIVEVMGHVGMGAQRWINLGFIKLQPSEMMKIAVVMALARYFHNATLHDMRRILFLLPALLLVVTPVGLVMVQPDLGTSLMILGAGGAMFFIAGAPIWMFLLAIAGVAAAIPVGWHFLHDYQKNRVMTFLDPERDPLGAGYHITQSKIALGSGGIEGKGFMQGSQSYLDYLPEKQTDFIFTLWAEEWGLIGGIFLFSLMGLVFAYGIYIAARCRHNYGRLLAMGLTVNFSLYVIFNTAMVMGLIPVVGIPLPLISHGGTAMLSCMAGFGLIMSCSVYKDSKVNRV